MIPTVSEPLPLQKDIPLAAKEEMGSLGVVHLKRFWSERMAGLNGSASNNLIESDWVADNTLLSGLRLGLRETLNYIYANHPAFDRFEAWILEKTAARSTLVVSNV